MKTATDRLDDAILKLETISDEYEVLLKEDANSDYRFAWLEAKAKSGERTQIAKGEDAERNCYDLGLEGRLRASKVKHEAVKFRATQTRAILDGLRSKLAGERIGI